MLSNWYKNFVTVFKGIFFILFWSHNFVGSKLYLFVFTSKKFFAGGEHKICGRET